MTLVGAVFHDLAVRDQVMLFGFGTPVAQPRLGGFRIGGRQGLEFLAGRFHILPISLAGLEPDESGRREQPGGIHVTLPMIARDHAALTPLIASLEQRVLPLGIQFRQNQGHTPAADGVTGRIGTASAGPFLLPGEQGPLPIEDIGAQTHIGRLGPGRSEPEGTDAPVQQVHGLRRGLP